MPRVKLFDQQVVLIKAMNLFWKQGYAATSVQDLVTHLGINRASLYDTYGDKEQLFRKALEHYRKVNIEGLTQFFQNQPDVKKGFSRLFDNLIQESISDTDRKGCFVVNTTTELVPNDESIQQALESNKQNFETLFYNYFKKGKESGQLKTEQDLKSLASLYFTIYNGIRVVSKIKPNKQELSKTVEAALSLLY